MSSWTDCHHSFRRSLFLPQSFLFPFICTLTKLNKVILKLPKRAR